MTYRYAELSTAVTGVREFVVRQRTPTITQLLLTFAAAAAIEIGIIASVNNLSVLVMLLLAVIAAIGWYAILQVQRSRDLVLTTEFQNAMFASALGINNKFCLIIRQNGHIVYLDTSFQQLFPNFLKQPQRTIDVLLEYEKVSQEDRRKILNAIEHGVYDKVMFNVRDAEGKFHRLVMSIEPILRPSGFILLRGREYIEQRDEKGIAVEHGSILSKSTVTLFSYVMDSMEMGVYMTGPAGNIIYANPILEQWLGFREGEITTSNLSLQDIIYHGGNRAQAIQPDNYEGVVTLQKKAGGLMQSFINQKIIRNDKSKAIGCTALVHHVGATDATPNKKLW